MFTKGRLLQASLSSSEKTINKQNKTKPTKEKTKAALPKYSTEKKNLLYYSDINAINYLKKMTHWTIKY